VSKHGLVPWSEVFNGPLGLVGVQIFPTVLLHINHPFSEVLGAVVFGVLGGIWVLRYRSILPVLVLHWFAGLVSDGVIIFFG
jgi:membrane protease YdiL (CAAX protease family)